MEYLEAYCVTYIASTAPRALSGVSTWNSDIWSERECVARYYFLGKAPQKESRKLFKGVFVCFRITSTHSIFDIVVMYYFEAFCLIYSKAKLRYWNSFYSIWASLLKFKIKHFQLVWPNLEGNNFCFRISMTELFTKFYVSLTGKLQEKWKYIKKLYYTRY